MKNSKVKALMKKKHGRTHKTFLNRNLVEQLDLATTLHGHLASTLLITTLELIKISQPPSVQPGVPVTAILPIGSKCPSQNPKQS